nr:hypothetical protein BaRGS_000278 [Batillaria attramentaria]
MTIGILIPNVEFILGLNGAITGTLICYIFPALFFLRVMSSKAEGKTIAQMVLVLGVSILLISTFTVLYTQDKGHVHKDADPPVTQAPHRIPDKPVNGNIGAGNVEDGGAMKEDKGKRVEPPNPDAPGPDVKEKRDADDNPADNKKAADTGDGQNAGQVERPSENEPGGGDKEDANGGKEGGGPALAKQEPEQRQEQLLAALEEQRREQQKLLQEQKELLKELKDHKEQDHEIRIT